MKFRKFRPALVTFIIVAIFASALAIPSVRAAAVNFLGIFRVQQIEVVEFNPANLPANFEQSVMDFEQVFAGSVEFSENGDPVEGIDGATARDLAGFNVKFPVLDEPVSITYQPGGQAVFQIDRDLWQALLNDFGQTEVKLPASIDGETVTIRIANSVTTLSGACADVSLQPGSEFDHARFIDCIALVQMPSPEIDAPADLPVTELGQTLLQIFGMSPDEAARFSARVDWSTTLIIPVPQGAEYRDVTINGTPGTMFRNEQRSRSTSYSVMWVENGILYGLSVQGEYTANQVLAIAESLR